MGKTFLESLFFLDNLLKKSVDCGDHFNSSVNIGVCTGLVSTDVYHVLNLAEGGKLSENLATGCDNFGLNDVSAYAADTFENIDARVMALVCKITGKNYVAVKN